MKLVKLSIFLGPTNSGEKQKKLMVEEYNSLKDRNEFLKAQLAEAKKVAAGETEEERNSSEAEKFCSATASAQVFLHNQPSIVPCFWPPIIPSSDVFPFQCASHPHQFLMPPGDIPCLHQGQEHSMGNPRPGAPLLVVPVPWLLPLHTHHCGKCSCSDNSNHMPSSQNMSAEAYNHMHTMCADSDGRAGASGAQCSVRQPIVVPGLFTPVRPRETVEPPRSCQVDDIADLRLVSALESMRHGLLRTNQEPIKKAEDVFVATEARRRRKELMKLKNIHCK